MDTHVFNHPEGWYDPETKCNHCGLKSKNEFKKPNCLRAPGAVSKPIPTKKAGAKAKCTRDWSTSGWHSGPRCYDKHPEVKLGSGIFIGGSCSMPKVKDANVYIGFQSGMRKTKFQYPWEPGVEIEFAVTDYDAPHKDDRTNYVKLVDWTVDQLEQGARVHAGCIGGHGRTGMFLAALLSRFGEDKPIAKARAIYCHKAVESKEQIKFLAKHFGCEADAEPAKPRSLKTNYGKSKNSKGYTKTFKSDYDPDELTEKFKLQTSTKKTVEPIPSALNIWGTTLDPEKV